MPNNKCLLYDVGFITDEIIECCNLQNFNINRNIVKSKGLYKHILKHKSQYLSSYNMEYSIEHICEILNDPIFVFFNSKNFSLEYYGFLKENVCVIVKLQTKKNCHSYIASIYPVTSTKIINRQNKMDSFKINS